MAGEGKAIANAGKGKKRRYLPHGKPVRKGGYPLRPGAQGFFLTCDGGKEIQAANEAINLLDSFYEEMVYKKDSKAGAVGGVSITKPLNKKIKFKDSDSDSSGDEDEEEESPEEKGEIAEKEIVEEIEEEQTKKQKVENVSSVSEDREKPIDELINEELREMGDKKKRKFFGLETNCHGVIFIQMQKKDADPSPTDIVHHIMNSAFSTRKQMSRFILRLTPVEVSCYPSEEEITRAIKPLIEKHFPEDSSTPEKFAVHYGARANTGMDRMKIINAVAKCVPSLHKVDLKNPDKTIVVEIVKTNCLIGVVEKYKKFSKFNLRELTSPSEQ